MFFDKANAKEMRLVCIFCKSGPYRQDLKIPVWMNNFFLFWEKTFSRELFSHFFHTNVNNDEYNFSPCTV